MRALVRRGLRVSRVGPRTNLIGGFPAAESDGDEQRRPKTWSSPTRRAWFRGRRNGERRPEPADSKAVPYWLGAASPICTRSSGQGVSGTVLRSAHGWSRMAGPVYSFGPFRLEGDERRLLRDGAEVPL